ncbi:MAG: YraN family protein [Paracoccaceae bacterium]
MQKKSKGEIAYYGGRAAEMQVAAHYMRRGYSLEAERWRCPSGEIDLVLRCKNALAFVEVKRSKTHSMAVERIGARQIDRLYNAAMAYLAAKQLPLDTNIRFDVATLDSIGTIEIVENAFA